MKMPRYLRLEVPITIRMRAKSVQQMGKEPNMLTLDIIAPRWAWGLAFIELSFRMIVMGVKAIINQQRYLRVERLP